MIKVIFFAVLILFFCPFMTFSQTADNAELKKMYNEDQNSRMSSNIDWNELSKEDNIREKRVYELINSGQIITGMDYYHSAMIFQHGKDTIASGMAVRMMKKAIELDSTVNKWLLAAAIDRDLMRRGKPQIYGTQYTKFENSKLIRYKIDTTQITDKERIYYHVETLSEQKVKEKRMNMLSISEYFAKSNSLENTIALIKSENAKGLEASYDASEGSINGFGYKLLNSGKMDEALRIFTLNTELYPKGFNTYDSLGECLFKLNRKDEGIKAYKTSLELNPKNENAKKVLNEQK